jgi:hypothetical protein
MALNPIRYASSAFPGQPTGQPRLKFDKLPESCPILRQAYRFDQELSIAAAGFPPAPNNTPSTNAAFGIPVFTPPSAGQTSAHAILTSVTQPADKGAALLEYTGSFSLVPASWDDFQTQVVNFPGWLNVIGNNFRDPKPTEVNVRLHYDYFVIDPALLTTGVRDSGGTNIVKVAAKGAIPILRRTPWLATYGGAVLANDEAKSLVPTAGVMGYLPTLPTIEQYRLWCGVATAFLAGAVAWDETHPPLWNGASSADVLSGQFRLANSRLIDYAGNIVARVTTYALAE